MFIVLNLNMIYKILDSIGAYLNLLFPFLSVYSLCLRWTFQVAMGIPTAHSNAHNV